MFMDAPSTCTITTAIIVKLWRYWEGQASTVAPLVSCRAETPSESLLRSQDFPVYLDKT